MADIIKAHKCPICHKVVAENKYKPFCSKRCADIDLGRWFDGSYVVPVQELDEKDYEVLEELSMHAKGEEDSDKE